MNDLKNFSVCKKMGGCDMGVYTHLLLLQPVLL